MDRKFIQLFLSGWIVVLVLRLSPFFGVWAPVDNMTWLVVALWLGAFGLGYLAARSLQPLPIVKPVLVIDPGWQDLWIRRFSLAAIVCAVILTYEFAINRGYGFGRSAFEIRIMESARVLEFVDAPSIIGGIGRLLSPTLQVAWVLACLSWDTVRKRTFKILLFATAVLFIEQFMFEGGRNYWAALLVECLIARWVSSKPISFFAVFKRILIGGVVVGFILNVFVVRANFLNNNFLMAYSVQTIYHDFSITPEIASRVQGDLGPLNFAVNMLWLYITQGIHQLDVILQDTGMRHAWGMHQFSIFGQILEKLAGVNLRYNDMIELANPATYPTLIGAGVVDFGTIGSILFGGLIGFFTTLGLRRIQSGKNGWLAVSAPIWGTIVIFSPILSMVPTCWIAIVWVWVATRFMPRVVPARRSQRPDRIFTT